MVVWCHCVVCRATGPSHRTALCVFCACVPCAQVQHEVWENLANYKDIGVMAQVLVECPQLFSAVAVKRGLASGPVPQCVVHTLRSLVRCALATLRPASDRPASRAERTTIVVAFLPRRMITPGRNDCGKCTVALGDRVFEHDLRGTWYRVWCVVCEPLCVSPT